MCVQIKNGYIKRRLNFQKNKSASKNNFQINPTLKPNYKHIHQKDDTIAMIDRYHER